MNTDFNKKRNCGNLQNRFNKISIENDIKKPVFLPQDIIKEVIKRNNNIEFVITNTDKYIYDNESKTLILARWSGIGSCWVVLTHFLIQLKAYYDIVPENIVTSLYLYRNYNLYNEIFYINKKEITNFKKLDNKHLLSFLEKNRQTAVGLGNSKDDLDLNLIDVIFKSYFNITDLIHNRANEIIKKYGINLNNFNFILWRKTDKVNEITNYPSLDEALNLLNGNFLNLIAHTDDLSIYNRLNKYKDVITLEELPLCSNDRGGHHEVFLDRTKIVDEKSHIVTMIAIIYIASKSNMFIGYPGNLSWIVSVLKKFNNTYLIKGHNSFF